MSRQSNEATVRAHLVAESHDAQLFSLYDDASVDDLAAALATGNPAAALQVGTFGGGPGLVSPGEESRADAIVDLTVGTYALLCFVEDANGEPHLANGMLHPFEVTSATAEDVREALEWAEAPPATYVGGMPAILPGAAQWLVRPRSVRVRRDLLRSVGLRRCAAPLQGHDPPRHDHPNMRERAGTPGGRLSRPGNARPEHASASARASPNPRARTSGSARPRGRAGGAALRGAPRPDARGGSCATIRRTR